MTGSKFIIMDLNGITVNNRFKIDKKIAEGKISDLYRAYDLENNNTPVTVKFLKNNVISSRIEDVIRYRTEVNAVSELEHQNIIKIYEVGEITELHYHYIVSEHITNVTLSKILRDNKISVEESIDFIIQMCSALDYVHNRNIIHGDIKPGNVLVLSNSIKLTDFGLVHVKEFNETIPPEEILEIFGYMSPEQSGIVKKSMDERSDLYSVGVIFYQLLTGKLPFVGSDISSIVHKQIAKIPESPGSLNPEIPEILGRIVLKLLEKEPENRYHSARGVLTDLEKYSGGQNDFILGLNDSFIRLSYRTKLIGREDELDRLKDAFNRALNGNGGIYFITGEAGSGKTRLAEEFRDYIYSREALLIDGKCDIQKNKIPYEPFRDALTVYIKNFRSYNQNRKGQVAKGIRDNFRNFGEIILKLNHEMKEILGDCPPLVSIAPEMENKRFLMSASQFFLGLSDIEKGMVVLIEDLHWTDEGTLNLLNEISLDISGHPLVIIVSYRDDEIAENHTLSRFLHEIKNKDIYFQEIHIDSFDFERMNRFISGLLIEPEKNTREIAEFILDRSKGNPFFTIEILKQLIEEKVLFYQENRWNIDKKGLDGVEIPQSILDVILKRVHLLDDMEKTILSYAAVIGGNFDLDLLIRLGDNIAKNSGKTNNEIDLEILLVSIVDRAIDLQILEVDSQYRGKLSFVHDRIKEAFYNNIEEEERKKFHLAIAIALEEKNRDTVGHVIFDLAHHYIKGGDIEKSITYAYPAGLRAMENYANEVAAEYFRFALELLEQAGHEKSTEWIAVLKSLGEVYLTIGDYDEAIDILQRILPFTTTGTETAEAYSQICTAYFKKGDWKKCEEYGRIGLKLLGEVLPIKRTAVILSSIKELLVHILHTIFPKIFVRDKDYPKGKSGERYRRMEQFHLSLIWSFVLSDNLKFFRFSLRALNKAESLIGKSKALGMAIGGYASLCMAIPFFKRAIKYHEKALRLRIELNDEWGIAQSYQWMGYCYEWKGEFDSSIYYFKMGAERFKKIGDIRELGMSLCGIVLHYYIRSDYINLQIENEEYFKVANKAGDNFEISTSWIFSIFYYLETGGLGDAEVYIEKLFKFSYKKRIWFAYCIASILQGCLYLEKNEAAKAIESLEKAKGLFESNDFLKQHTVFLYNYLAEAYLAEYLAKKRMTEKQKKAYLKKIKASCQEALSRTKSWLTWHGSAYRVNAIYYGLIGKNKKAEKLFLQSIEMYNNNGRRFEYARSYYEYGFFLLRTANLKEYRECLEKAYKIFREIGSKLYIERIHKQFGIADERAEPTSIIRLVDKERFISISKLAQDISKFSDINELLNEVLIRAVEITGAQRGSIFLIDKEELEEKATVSIEEHQVGEYSLRIVKEVFNTERQIIFENAQKGKEYNIHNIMPANELKSILCIPIKEREKTIGVCYLDNSLSSGVFTEKEADLLIAFFSQLAYAIENVLLLQLFEDLKDSRAKGKEIPVSSSIEERIKRVEDKIKKAINYIDVNYSSDISREGLAALIDLHPDNLGRYFKLYSGKKMNDYINELRIKDAAQRLKETDKSIIDIAFAVGFESLSTFKRAFSKIMKISPSSYRKQE